MSRDDRMDRGKNKRGGKGRSVEMIEWIRGKIKGER